MSKSLAARSSHIELGDKLVAEGKLAFGAAILDESGQMCRSILICNFQNRQELDEYLKQEPYATSNVWNTVDILNVRVGPSFQKLFPQLTG